MVTDTVVNATTMVRAGFKQSPNGNSLKNKDVGCIRLWLQLMNWWLSFLFWTLFLISSPAIDGNQPAVMALQEKIVKLKKEI